MNTAEAAIAEVLPNLFGDGASGRRPQTESTFTIPEGRRDNTLASLAGKLRRDGLSTEGIAAALHAENRQRCQPPLSDHDVNRIATSIGRYPSSSGDPILELKTFTLAQLAQHVFPPRHAILMRGETAILRAGHLAQVYAERGFGKSWFAMTIGLVAASNVEALGFSSARPCRVIYIDGEMGSEEIQERFALLRASLRVPETAPVTVLGADWQETFLPRLDTEAGQAAVEPHVDGADLVILDNRSCLFDPDGEKDGTAWQPAQDYLLSLRRRGKAVITVHHSNRMGGARGHSKAEDPMNLLIRLSKPDDYSQDQGARFLVTFDKSRGAFGAAVAPFLAHLTPAGWHTESGIGRAEICVADKLVEQVRLAHEAGDPIRSANRAVQVAKVNREAGLKAWKALLESGAIQKTPNDEGFRAR